GGQRRHVLFCLSCTSFYQRMDPKSRDGLAAPIQEHVVAWAPALHQRGQFPNHLRPQRTPTGLVSFASDQNRGQITVGNLWQYQVADSNLGGFIGPSARVV